MKNHLIKLQFLATLILAVFITSCHEQEFAAPEPISYSVDTVALGKVISIADLKAMHLGSDDSLTRLDTAIYLVATVVANDEAGNYYKKIVLQDSTGGIEIGVNATGLHNIYPEGQLVYVKCEGLFLGEYGQVVSLGADYEGSVGRIEEPLIGQFLLKSDGGKQILPKVVVIGELSSNYVGTLITLENVQFKSNEIGNTFADGIYLSTSDISLQDCDKKTVSIRSSGYANFAGEALPIGNGTLTAVYSEYNGDAQLYVRHLSEVNLDGVRCGAWYEEDFAGDISNYKSFSIKGDVKAWEHGSQGGKTYAIMTGYYGGREESDDWLVSPAINLSGKDGATFKFDSGINYSSGCPLSDIEVYISSTYNGTDEPAEDNGTWTMLVDYNKPVFGGSNWLWANSGDIDISSMNGEENVYLAFRYRSTTAKAMSWEVTNIEVSVNP